MAAPFAVGALLYALAPHASEAKPRTIRGLVTDQADAPLRNVLIELNCTQKDEVNRATSTKSNADGRFQLEATLRGACKLKLTAPGFSTALVPIPDSPIRAVTDVGKVRLQVSCSGPGVHCDEVTPVEAPVRPDKPMRR